ncbi:MAG: EAL domain-containing protein [Solirubrobacterales bacterium]|nr:EAL domain-containing protein [Solirubrobacterales bacterium]
MNQLGVLTIAKTTAARRLDDSERRHRSVLDVLAEGVMVIDPDGRLVEANPAACAILGIELAAARADPQWWRVMSARHKGDGSDLDIGGTVLQTGQGVRDVAVVTVRPDGTSVQLSVNYQPLRDETGGVCGLVLSFSDVTAQDVAAQHAAAERDFFQATLDSLSAQIAVLGEQGEIVMTNRAWVEFAAAEDAALPVLGEGYLEACDAAKDDATAAQAAAGVRSIMAGDATEFSLEYPAHCPTAERWYMLRAARFDGPGSGRVVIARSDATERRRTQGHMDTQSALLDEVDVAVVAAGADGRVTHWNRGAERLYGWTNSEAVGRDAAKLLSLPETNVEEVVAEMRRDGHWEGERTVAHKDGSAFPAYLRGRVMLDREGKPAGWTGVTVDMSKRLEAERALRASSNYLRAVADSVGEGLFTLDTDGRVTYMNAAAEELLGWTQAELAGRVMHEVAHTRRLDGSALPLAESPISSAVRDGVSRRIDDDVFIRRDGRGLPVAYTAAPFETSDGVHGCVVVFKDISERKAREQTLQRDVTKLAWIGRIQGALAEDRFVLYAQPIVELRSGEVAQRELLLRMREPGGEVVSPGEYLGIAEQYGLIGDIDRWVIRRGAEIAAAGDPVEINLSAHSIGDQSVLDHIDRCIDESGADPKLLVFEITETALIADEVAARAFAQHLHDLGCKLALDDFGTGYGGFTYLKQLPLDFLKIDIEFVRDLVTNPASCHVVQAVVALARGFGLQTVAEGVEDDETFELLLELGVDYAQGYHIARPAPLDEAVIDKGGRS